LGFLYAAGQTNEYKHGRYVKREFVCASKPERYEIRYREVAEHDFQPVSRDLVYKLHLDKKPSAVIISGEKLKASKLNHIDELVYQPVKKAEWGWDKVRGRCVIRIPATAVTGTIEIEK
jgi:hypothetical protein